MMTTNTRLSAFCAMNIFWLVSSSSPVKDSTNQNQIGPSSSSMQLERVNEDTFTPDDLHKLQYLSKDHDYNNLFLLPGIDDENHPVWSKKNDWNNLKGMWGKKDSDDVAEKRNNWNNLSGMWGKRSKWNDLNGMWGKRNNDWNNLSGMWGKKSDWNNLSGMWGKRNDWNNLSGMWGKKSDWNNLSGMWGKRNNWNNLSGMWGKRDSDVELKENDLTEDKKNNWNSLKGAWGKRSNWNNFPEVWARKLINEAQLAEEARKRTRWNNLNGMWGKRSVRNSDSHEIFEDSQGKI